MMATNGAFADVRVRRLTSAVEPPSPLAIVFVHGFNSSAETAFRNASGIQWSDIVHKDERPLASRSAAAGPASLAAATNYSIDYSPLSNTTSASADVSIEDISRAIADKDDFRAIFRNHQYVWIIAHSMGGVVAKRALMKLNAAEPDAFGKLIGMSLIAVPANGAPLAGRSTGTMLGSVVRIVWGVSERQLRELTGIDGGNSYLQAMRTDWAVLVDTSNRRRRLYLACAYEGLPTPVTGGGITIASSVVVPQLYSDSKCVGEDARINADHFQIVKPSSQESPIHEWLYTTLRTALRDIGPTAGAPAQTTSPRAAECAATKDEPDDMVVRPAPDGTLLVSARRSVVQKDGNQRFTSLKIAEEYAKGDLIRNVQQYVRSERFTTEAQGRPEFRETVQSLAKGNLSGVLITQSCYVDGIAWVRLEYRRR
jgi:pimeloyl-ACP methyl ester carboxylesterase